MNRSFRLRTPRRGTRPARLTLSLMLAVGFWLGSRNAAEAEVIYEVNFYQLQDDAVSSFDDYSVELDAELSTLGGRSLGQTLRVDDPLIDNPALPSAARPFNFDRVTFHEHADRATFDGFQTTNDALSAQFFMEGDITGRTRFLADATSLLGPGLPLYGDNPTRGGDSFISLNAIQFDPDRAADFNTFAETAVPLIAGEGAGFFQAFTPTDILEGQFGFAFLNLTEWDGLESFQSVHTNPDLLAVAPFRDSATADFFEARVSAVPEPSSMAGLAAFASVLALRCRRRSGCQQNM